METFQIEYRNISPKDLDKILRFTDRWIGKGYFQKDELRVTLLKGIKDDLNANFIAVIDDKIIGVRICFAPGEWINIKDLRGLSPGSWGVDMDKIAYFKSLFIHDKYQGKGIGSKLSRLAIEKLKQMGAEAILAHAWQESPEDSSRKYMSKMGFRQVADHRKFWYLVDYECTRCGADERCICTASEMVLTL